MRIGRNEPCPCGSGRKYKRCCMRLEQSTGSQAGLGAELRRAAASAPHWEVDLVPIPAAFEDDPAARPASVLVMASDLIVHARVLARPSAEDEDIAAELAREILQASEALGARPRRLVVRRPLLAERLAALLRSAGWDPVVEAGDLPSLDDAAVAMRADISGGPPSRSFPCSVTTWAGWGLGEAWCAALFERAAAFYRAAPWSLLDDDEWLEVRAGGRWTASVMGSGGIQLGLVLYERLEDLEGIFVEEAEDALERLEGKVISLAFDPGSELPRPMRREVAAAGWEVAAADAYPYLFTINTPAGGLTKADAADLLAALEAVPAFLEAHGEEIEAGASPLAFEHAATGTEVRADWGEMGRVARVWLEAVPLTAGTLAPGDAQGAGARPEAALDSDFDDAGLERLAEAELEVVDSYERALAGEGLSASTIRRHVETARRFVEFLAWSQGIPLAAIHEYDLREYLYDWFPRKEMTSETQAKAARGSLRRFLRYLSAGQEISLPRAWDLLGKKEAFEARCAGAPAGAWWDSDVQEWRETHYLSLQLDLLVHDPTLAGGEPWGAFMGPVEARLDRELQRRWLLWRDDQLRRRADPDPDDLLRHLTERQRAWETTPQAKLAGKSPAEAIAAERREHQERLRDGPPREV